VFSCGGDAEYVDDEDEDDSLDEDGFDKLTELSIMPELGHGGGGMVPEPRKIEALTGMDVIGVAAGFCRMAVWTGGGELFTFGYRPPGGQPHMVGIDAHIATWTANGELFTFGDWRSGKLCHGVTEEEHVPRLVAGLAEKKVVGAVAGMSHTAVWTDGGEIFTFGNGQYGRLGHGIGVNEHHNDEARLRLVDALMEV